MKNLLRNPCLIVVCAFGLAFSFFVVAALVARIAYGGSEEALWGATLWSLGFGAVTITLGSVYALSVAADVRRERQKPIQPPVPTRGKGRDSHGPSPFDISSSSKGFRLRAPARGTSLTLDKIVLRFLFPIFLPSLIWWWTLILYAFATEDPSKGVTGPSGSIAMLYLGAALVPFGAAALQLSVGLPSSFLLRHKKSFWAFVLTGLMLALLLASISSVVVYAPNLDESPMSAFGIFSGLFVPAFVPGFAWTWFRARRLERFEKKERSNQAPQPTPVNRRG